MIVSFFGHKSIFDKKAVYVKIKSAISNLISEANDINFYCGGYGDFDNLCLSVCKAMQIDGAKCEISYVTPYINCKSDDLKNYDSIIYPPIENTPPKFAISKRNEWIITQSDIVIAYIEYSYGGAYKALRFAKRKKKRIINLADYN